MSAIIITETHECLPFCELSEALQQQLIEQRRQDDLEYRWWDDVYAWFTDTCADIYGIEVEEMTFRGFWSQGHGAAFKGSVRDIDKLLNNVYSARVVPDPLIYRRVIRHMFSEWGLSLTTKPTGLYGTAQAVYVERYGVNPHADQGDRQQKHCYHAEKSIDWLEDAWEDICVALASDLYSKLEQEYEYLTSDEAIINAFADSGAVFDKDTGEIFYQ